MGTPCPFFCGRKEILERLDSFFSPRNTERKPRREFLLFGMGGVGKSEIALKVAQDLEYRYVCSLLSQTFSALPNTNYSGSSTCSSLTAPPKSQSI